MGAAVQDVVTLAFVAGLAGGVGYLLSRIRTIGGGTSSAAESSVAPEPSRGAEPSELHRIARELGPAYNASAYAADLLEESLFQEGLALLRAERPSVETLLGYYTGDSATLACLGLEALAERGGDPDVRPEILDGLNDYIPWTRYFALRVLDRHTPGDRPVVGRVLGHIDGSWNIPLNIRILREFLELRAGKGEPLTLGPHVEGMDDDDVDNLLGLLGRMPPKLTAGLRKEVADWRSTRIDRPFLASIGQILDSDQLEQSGVLRHETLDSHADNVVSLIQRKPRRSVVLVGERGVGKSMIARVVAQRMARQGWVVWQAGHKDLIAGMVYIGELEQRMRELLEKLDGRKVLWLVDEFHALALSGRHKYGPMSVLDYLLPRIESGDLVVLGETAPRSFERLVQSKPRVLTSMETLRIEPLGASGTRELVEMWADAHRLEDGNSAIDARTRREGWLLADQYLSDWAAPGNVLSLLDLTRRRCAAGASTSEVPLGADDLITTLAQLTGLPATILDERQGLNLEALREHFENHVKGQREAIDALVERVAMIKAGVTDPTRPFGVFLFVGPTGTGKTEIAKTLAGFLFGSPDRMIRLDMSEFKDPESIQRLIGGGTSEPESEALVDRIRKQPFSVLLLDEFEKAHPNTWDLFLQVFDDGRLTDRSGNTADFRNAIIIMTSNLGSRIPAGTSLGFSDGSGSFNESTVLREVKNSFRPEFLNRIDQVIVFRPLERETMRRILRKELGEAFKRRGLRNRDWAVEWDGSALEFLLERGFAEDLGARPLKRAIERHVLAPLAITLVDHHYPEGDQFVFVRSENDRLVAEFVDPNVPEDDPETDDLSPEASGTETPLCRIALDPRGRPEEMATLRLIHERLCQTIDDEEWQECKQTGLESIGDPDFWASEARFGVLGQVEYLDRIEAGVKSAGSLLGRLSQRGAPRPRYPRDLVGRVASQLYLLDAACRGIRLELPREAFVRVESWSESGTPSHASEEFARQIGGMYRAWADRRRMQYEILAETSSSESYGLLLSISGFAAFPILAGEHGLHLLEVPSTDGKKIRKYATRVRVAPQPEEPPGRNRSLVQQAREVLGELNDDALAIIRRYRRDPSPLVRDVAKGWRTGKLDRVLGGDFDLLGAERIEPHPTP